MALHDMHRNATACQECLLESVDHWYAGPYDPNDPNGPPPQPPSAWQHMLHVVGGIMHFFGRLSFLVDENAHAVHFFVSALLQLLDRYVTFVLICLLQINHLSGVIFISCKVHSASRASKGFPVRVCGGYAQLLVLPVEIAVIIASYSIAACLSLCVYAYIVSTMLTIVMPIDARCLPCDVLLATAMRNSSFHILAISAVLLNTMCLHAELGLCMVSWLDLSSACWVSGQRQKRLRCSQTVKSLGHPPASPVPTPCPVYLGPLPIGLHPSLLAEVIGTMCGRRKVHPRQDYYKADCH